MTNFTRLFYNKYNLLYNVYRAPGQLRGNEEKMDCVRKKAYAKINLGLDVLRRRPDGYHEVKMIMQTVDIWDLLTIQRTDRPGIFLRTDKEELPSGKDNLVYKAAEAVFREYGESESEPGGQIPGGQIPMGQIPDGQMRMGQTAQGQPRDGQIPSDRIPRGEGVEITLQKRIPMAAGMAGGSADAAAVFHGLNELFGLGMSLTDMQRLGVRLGADIPYCLMGGTALAEGIGERLTRLPAPPQAVLLVAKPDIDVSTRFVYENLHAEGLREHPDIDGMVRAIREGSMSGITGRMGNVLETVTVREYPVIDQIKKLMLGQGAENALMSGSGPSVFGVFKEEAGAQAAAREIERAGLAGQIFVTGFYNPPQTDQAAASAPVSG